MSAADSTFVITPCAASRGYKTITHQSTIRRTSDADFEAVSLAAPGNAVIHERRSSGSYTNVDLPLQNLEAVQQDLSSQQSHKRSITRALLGKCSLPPLISRATNSPASGLHTRELSEPASPTSTVTSLVISNSGNATGASTSTAKGSSSSSTRNTSRIMFENFFGGTSAPVTFGIPPLSSSQSNSYADGYEVEGSFTRAPARSVLTMRPRGNSRAQSSSSSAYGGRLGDWFTGSRTSTTTSKGTPVGIAAEDPLLNLDIAHMLFPHGPANPMNPKSFHDLHSASVSLAETFQSSYKMKCTEVRDTHTEVSALRDEVEERETRAQHLKMQLDGMAAQLAAQQKKADMFERMLEEERVRRRSSEGILEERRARLRSPRESDDVAWERNHRESDSGFESDDESVFSEGSRSRGSDSTIDSEDGAGRCAQKVGMVRVQHSTSISSCPNCTLLSPSASGSAALRIENSNLKTRVLELEDALEGCLELVSSPWGSS